MRLRPIIALLLISTHAVYADETSLQKGEKALSSHLWEVAAKHFQEALSSGTLDGPQKARISILLAEAWLRDSKPNKSLELLNAPHLVDHIETPFWKGQALAALGRFAEAVEALSPIALNPQAPNRHAAGFTAASLELALGEADSALTTLSTLTDSTNPELAALARLRQAQILIDLNRVQEAREVLPSAESIAAKDSPLANFITANILFQEGKYDDAEKEFRRLVEDPRNQTVKRYHTAVIGLADTLIAKDDDAGAADLLLKFIQENPDSPQLQEIFKRLLATIPENPTATDSILERLTQWIPPSQIPATGLINTQASSAVAAWPTESTSNDLQVFAEFTRASGLYRINTPEAKDEAHALLDRLRIENPTHFLATRALLQAAKWNLSEGKTDRAFAALRSISETATSPFIRGEAAFVQAISANNEGDPQLAIALFDEAAKSLDGIEADTAKFNAALIELANAMNPDPDAEPINNPTLASSLQLEQALAVDDWFLKRNAIELFLSEHPDHPRTADARIKVAEAALASANPDISFAKAQIETIKSDPKMVESLKPVDIDLIQLRIQDLAGEEEETIKSARKLIADYPSSDAAEEAALILGRNLYQTRNYNDARIILEKLATSVSEPARAQAALLLAARSAALVPTTQSQQEALTLFDKTIQTGGPVTSLAKLEKGRLMIDMSLLTEATEFLRNWHQTIPTENPLYLPAGLLLGESIYAQGNINPNSLTDALKTYDQLLETTEPYSAVYNRLQYLRGKTLEQLPVEGVPNQTRDKQAFIAYYSVLERTTPPEEWQYFELCGFRALSLLEKAQRWPAAIACAKKIASFKGPRAEEAAARASQLQLQHMIWED